MRAWEIGVFWWLSGFWKSETRVFKEKGRVVNQKNHSESIRPFDGAQDRAS